MYLMHTWNTINLVYTYTHRYIHTYARMRILILYMCIYVKLVFLHIFTYFYYLLFHSPSAFFIVENAFWCESSRWLMDIANFQKYSYQIIWNLILMFKPNIYSQIFVWCTLQKISTRVWSSNWKSGKFSRDICRAI